MHWAPGTALFQRVCELDLEGIVAKHKFSPYIAEREASTCSACRWKGVRSLPAAAEAPVCGLAIAQFANPYRHGSTNRMRKSTAGSHAKQAEIRSYLGWANRKISLTRTNLYFGCLEHDPAKSFYHPQRLGAPLFLYPLDFTSKPELTRHRAYFAALGTIENPRREHQGNICFSPKFTKAKSVNGL